MPPYARFKHPLEHERFRSLYVAWGQEKLVVPLQDLAFSTTLYIYICITVRAFCFCLQYYSKQFPHHQCQRNDITHGNEFTNKICTLFHHLSFNFANESAVLSKEMYGMVLLLLIRMGPCAFTNFRNIAKTHTHTLSILTTGSVKNPPKPPDLPGSCHWHHRCWWHWLAAARSTRCWWCWWWHWHLWHWWHLCSILGEPSTSSNRTIYCKPRMKRFSDPNNA